MAARRMLAYPWSMTILRRLHIRWRETDGQDLIEYALMAGFVAVAAGAIMPGVSTSVSAIFSKVASVMTKSAGS
jgi:pilus assembly protein Flp/PilA